MQGMARPQFRGMKGLKKQRRIQIVVLAFAALAISVALIGYAMRDGINFFRIPAQVIAEKPGPDEVFRLGGRVVEGSIVPGEGVRFAFTVTDGEYEIPVQYVGNDPRPDLFKEGTDTIATGRLVDGTFQATQLLAKHDEEYVPREVVEAMKDQGLYVPAE